jgi:hypothetical protein
MVAPVYNKPLPVVYLISHNLFPARRGKMLTEGLAIIIGTVLGAFISTLGVVLNLIFSERQRKADFKEKMYFEGFHRRIAVYENVLNTLSRMRTNKELPRGISLNDIKAKYHVYTHVLNILEVKLSLFGSPASVKIIRLLKEQLDDALVIPRRPDNAICADDVRIGFMGAISKTLSEFTESARAEAPIKIVDEFVHHSGCRIEMIDKYDQADHCKWKGKCRKKKNN